MPEAPLYSRRVSFNERIYLAEERLRPGFCIQIVVEGEGELEEEALRVAVTQAAAANPGSRLILSGMLGWTRWVAEGPVPPVRAVGTWAEDGDPPAEIERPLSPERGPTAEVVIAPSPRPRVVFRCFHGIMDARGLLHFAEDVFRALRGEPLVGSDCTLNDTEVLQSIVGNRARPALKSDCPTVTRGHSPAGARRVLWRRVTLDGPMPGLVARIAVCLARLAEQPPGSRTRVMVPVDVRNYQKGLRATGNLSYPLFLDVSPDQDWRRAQKVVLKKLAAKEPLYLDPAENVLPWLPRWLVLIIYALWTGVHRLTRRYPFSALVTHLGLSGVAPLKGGGFEARSLYILPMQNDTIPLTVSAVSSASSVGLVVSAPSALVDEAGLGRLCDQLRASLTADARADERRPA